MERRRFAFSWGRKIFFGIAWPLFCLLGLIFFKSGVLPKDLSSVFYFLLTSIGYYGVLTSVLYFLCFAPVAFIFPTYYFLRFWSAGLIIAVSSIIILDGFIFGEYRFHLNQVILDLAVIHGAAFVFNGSSAPFWVAGGVGIFIFFLLWIRGELLWRNMQRRFSNPVKNWYFIIILIALGGSHLIWKSHRTSFFGNEITLASLFPLNYQEAFFPKEHLTTPATRSHFNYPRKDLKCSAGEKSNIIMVVLQNIHSGAVSEEAMPFLTHLRMHGADFTQHFPGGGTIDDTYFRMLYGISASYRPESRESILLSEMRKMGYEMLSFSERNIPGLTPKGLTFDAWAGSHAEEDVTPPKFFFFDIASPGNVSETDARLRSLFTNLHREKLLQGSSIVIVGTGTTDWQTVPLIYVSSNRATNTFNHRTSHYDIAPTLLREVFSCKASVETYSTGKSLFTPPTKDWEIFGNEHSFRIFDFSRRGILETDWKGRILSGDSRRSELILEANREISRFYR